MRNQTVRLFIYSSLAIVALTLVWGLRQIPRIGAMAEEQLRTSLEQELSVVTSAVKSSTSALKFRLLDVLKAEGNDRPTRAFQDSPFVSAVLLEWDSSRWKVLWHSTKLKDQFQAADVDGWIKEWPLAKIAADEAFFAKVSDVNGQSHFALVVPVRRPSDTPMLGIGVFPASQFGLNFSADHSREVRVFDNKGFALALAHPAYVGASLKREPIIDEILDGDVLSVRQEWKSDRGVPMIGQAARLNDSNLAAAIETPLPFGGRGVLEAWIYLLFCAIGALVMNWVLFRALLQPLFEHLRQSEQLAEKFRRQLAELASGMSDRATQEHARPDGIIPSAELPHVGFIEAKDETDERLERPEAEGGSRTVPAPVHSTPLSKIVSMALGSLDARVREAEILVDKISLDDVAVESDALQLQLALEEVLKNAIEAMQGTERRHLNLEAHRIGGRVRLTVEDTGCGIPEGDVRKVFDPFFSTKDAEGVARGLGLNVVRRVIEELKGTVHVRNRMGSSGVIVEIEWPFTRPIATEPEQSGMEEPPSGPASLSEGWLDDLEEPFLESPVPPPASHGPPLRRSMRSVPPNPAIRRPLVRSLE